MGSKDIITKNPLQSKLPEDLRVEAEDKLDKFSNFYKAAQYVRLHNCTFTFKMAGRGRSIRLPMSSGNMIDVASWHARIRSKNTSFWVSKYAPVIHKSNKRYSNSTYTSQEPVLDL